jgi:hypothetical protein
LKARRALQPPKRPELYKVDKDGWFDTGDLARVEADEVSKVFGTAAEAN